MRPQHFCIRHILTNKYNLNALLYNIFYRLKFKYHLNVHLSNIFHRLTKESKSFTKKVHSELQYLKNG